jgi:ferredoxin
MREALLRGIHYEGPALFSIFSGATATVPDVPAYILAAAATESRAFPSFTYDPAAGTDWAARFDISHNPGNTADWPEHRVDYEDREGQHDVETVSFTFADFTICDTRYARFTHPFAREAWSAGMIPVPEWLALPDGSETVQGPYVLGVDRDNRLMRVVVDEKIVDAARRCNDAWRRLQELAGINNSHVLRQLSAARRERQEAARAVEPEALAAAAVATPQREDGAMEIVALAGAGEDLPGAAAGDGPWIETARCTTCNECVQVNKEMFAYNENRQAYIADPDAGTFRQLVEAAEGCQVSIIHPGKPRDPEEPNLAELLERAAPRFPCVAVPPRHEGEMRSDTWRWQSPEAPSCRAFRGVSARWKTDDPTWVLEKPPILEGSSRKWFPVCLRTSAAAGIASRFPAPPC